MKKFTGLAIGLFSVLSWANPMCVELCSPCADKIEDASCVKADALCGCAAILDSVAKAQEAEAAAKAEADAAEAAALEAKNEAISSGKKQLTLDLLEGCGGTSCERTLHFADGAYKFNELAEASADTGSSEADSTAVVDKIALLDGAGNLAEIAANICELAPGECTAKISYEGATMKLLSIQKQETATGLPQDTAAADSTESQDSDALASTASDSDPTTSENAVSSSSNPSPATPYYPSAKKYFYQGFGLSFGSFDENDFLGYDISGNNSIGDGSFMAGLSYIARWYFYSAGSIQTGLGVHFRHHSVEDDKFRWLGSLYYGYNMDGSLYDYDTYMEIEVEYFNISLEIPVGIRIGLPFKYFAPFVSNTFYIQKPLYGWGYLYIDGYGCYSGSCGEKDLDGDFYGKNDWEFIDWIGVGFEIAQHFSLEFQTMLFAERTGSAHLFDPDESFRINMQFTW